MKATKIIASLGVIAALGVATLPLGTYAATANADEIVSVTVNSALYLQIVSQSTEVMDAGRTDTTNLFADAFAATTSAAGYNLTLHAKTAADINLVSTASDKIAGSAAVAAAAPGTGTPGTNYTGGNYVWGINTTAWSSNGGTSGTAPVWASATQTMPTTSPVLVGTTSASNGATKSTSNVYRVIFGVTTATDQPTGTYNGTNTFTLTDK